MLPIMCIIDRYLLRQFVQTFLICFLSLTGLYIVFDVFSNLDQFIRCGHKAGGVLPFMAHYYQNRWLLIFDLTSGTLAMISAMFTLAWIQRHNEMTALMSAGVSRFRVLVPIIGAVAAVSLLSAASRELLTTASSCVSKSLALFIMALAKMPSVNHTGQFQSHLLSNPMGETFTIADNLFQTIPRFSFGKVNSLLNCLVRLPRSSDNFTTFISPAQN